jgi:2-polyprenyl-6-methoxyphenol hydroxylase-like FAD-dependent oxidoreductase
VEYDLITVGGGLAGAALGRALAERGRRVLVVEREPRFRDRVRGEYLEAWGTAEARALGLVDTLARAGGREVPLVVTHVAGTPVMRTDVTERSPGGAPPLCLSHPAMQEALLESARAAGAEVRRPAQVVRVRPGAPPAVEVKSDGGSSETLHARLVAGADGRDSAVRRWAGFAVERDPERLALAGLLLDGCRGPEEESSVFLDFVAREMALFFPQGTGRVRAYLAYDGRLGCGRLSGRRRVGAFLAECVSAGVPAAWLGAARAAGPLAAFQGADLRVDRPYCDGVVLVGDAAACSDPAWGCGLSLTLRDVRVLRDALLGSADWDSAARAYAAEHDRYYARLHTLEDWLTQAFFEAGPEADERRARMFARAATEPDRIPNLVAHGPDAPCDEAARRRCFAED